MALKASIVRHLSELRELTTTKLLDSRYERYRHLGAYEEEGSVHT